MRVLLLQDVYKLGRAGDVKRVADGYGRNYLIPQGLATLATPGALKQVEHIRTRATVSRTALNQEMSGVAEKLARLTLAFPARAGETGKLYGSITAQMITDTIQAKTGEKVDRRQVDTQPLRTLGDFKVRIRLTVDLIPQVRVVVYREGEAVELGEVEPAPAPAPEAKTVTKSETATEVETATEAESTTEAAG